MRCCRYRSEDLVGNLLYIFAVALSVAAIINKFISQSTCYYSFVPFAMLLAALTPCILLTVIFTCATKLPEWIKRLGFWSAITLTAISSLLAVHGSICNLRFTKGCINTSIMVSNLIAASYCLIIYVGIPLTLLLISKIPKYREKLAEARNFRESMKKAYDRTTPIEEVKAIMELRGTWMNLNPLDSNDLSVIRKLFLRRKSEESLAEAGCCYCSKEVASGKQYYQIPVCDHIYHLDCWSRFVKVKRECAVCSNGFREAAIKAIHLIE